ncbi:group III truncated hemoglobin [Ferruginibacter sp. SUN106]|uniref:group III truncated hemoglobin n=1 Tax=Ferruginibacter sp. SUN106 TaxID=2978348 RepID=UPI003D36B4A3
MKKDIASRADIEALIVSFYEKVKQDATIGFIFNDVVKIDWTHHIPVIVDFWESILLDNPVYKKNAMEVHYDLNKKVPLQKEHFESWMQLFAATVDELFEGKIASSAKVRAQSIASVMLFKMSNANNNHSIL